MHTLNHNMAEHLPPGTDWVQSHKQTISSLTIHIQSFLSEWEFIYRIQ